MTWPNSWATTASSCARERRDRAPSVTPMQAPPCRSLKAKAFMACVGTVRQRIGGTAGGDAHLFDDVGEALVKAVVGVERAGVHDADEVVAGAGTREEPVEHAPAAAEPSRISTAPGRLRANDGGAGKGAVRRR